MPYTAEEKRAYMQVYRETHREEIREQRAKYRLDHKEETHKYNVQYSATHQKQEHVRRLTYYGAHRKEILGKAVKYHAAHRERENQKSRTYHPGYYAKNREKLIAYAVEWQKKNPDKVLARTERRRAQKAAVAINDLTAAQWKEIQVAYNHCCVYCGRHKKGHLSQDHITPLAKGGNHTVANIVPACRSCNSKKGARHVLCPVQPLLLTIS